MHTNIIPLHSETHISSGNSYRVAKGAHHQQWTTYIIVIPLQHQRMEDDMHGDTPNRSTPPYYIYKTHLSAHIGALKSPRPN